MSNNKRSIDPAIIAAIIGVMGTVCVTFITLFASRLIPSLTETPLPQPSASQPATLELSPSPLPTWTITSTATETFTPVPTDTVPAGEPSSTAGPDTPTPDATLTPAPPAIGSDWANGCISILWRPYPPEVPTTANGGCLVEPVNLFFADDGLLTLNLPIRSETRQVFGLFAQLPASGEVSVSTLLRNMERGEIWMGVFAEPNVEAQGTAIVISGSARDRKLVQRTMPERIDSNSISLPQNPPLYDTAFEFSNDQVIAKALGETVTFDAIPVNSAQKWFFVGYQVQGGGDRTAIDADFLHLAVQGQ